MKHRLLALLCAFLITLTAIPTVSALEGEDLRTADTLAALGLVQGTTSGDYALSARATRAQAAVLLVRMSGEEQAARTSPWFSGHRDLPAWSAWAIDYAIHRNWVCDAPFALDFQPNLPITANQWCDSLLRLAGFDEKDYTMDDAAAFALRIGMLSHPCTDPVDRGMLFSSALDSLVYSHCGTPSRITQLVEQGVVSRPTASALGLLNPVLTTRQIADRHLAAVFQLDCYGDEVLLQAGMPASSATGFFISEDGLAVTNYHSIKGLTQAVATLSSGERFPVESVVWYDPGMDLAVLRISHTSMVHQTTKSFACLKLAGVKDLRTGDPVYAISNPLGLGLTVTSGEINAPLRIIEGTTLPRIVSTADISHGSSGGALLNTYGHVVGVTSGAYVRGNSMYLSIPVDTIMDLDLSGPGKTMLQIWEEQHSNS